MRVITLNRILLITSAVFLFAGCSDEGENDQQEERTRLVAVETLTMQGDNFEDYIRLTGTVEAYEDAVISAESQGRILEITNRGASLSRGDILARMDDRLIRAQYNSAQTAYELAEDNLNRLETLHADSIISTQDFNSARAQRDQARAQLEQAEKQLQDSNIEAPFNGRIEERMVQQGELVSPGMPVARIVNTNRVRILTGIPERYSEEITEGTPVEIEIRSGGETFSSTISYAGYVIDPDTRTFTVEIELQNPERRMKPDMVVNLRVLRRTLDDAMIIPRTAVIRNEDGISVFRVTENNGNKTAELVSVETGQTSGALVEIVSGIEPGDEIVFSGISNLNDGDRLNILNNETSVERADRLANAQNPFVSY
ncbi:efflux RND transporter periplasmic adaptor subunit [Rhodohalobacter sp. SW132]|uniref:efflux RND transporter periplasmic adaptor subunit n=1 Tax=Rhodohalobacter sp. SW132 TaxID=2293433 RepID=UPI000E247A67|nr:efflux RND transporter periplasmic adaptor subunit [Rhodohalobacter sp. SW132]REL24868.1 efflux RND transporter periplasmic adaptor subunit [Rhodohalobacter sp. SW132]